MPALVLASAIHPAERSHASQPHTTQRVETGQRDDPGDARGGEQFSSLALETGPAGKTTTALEGKTMKIYTRQDGMLALKPERIEACRAAGVVVLGFGERTPDDGIVIADCRPRGFVGWRGPDDPAATILYVGNVFRPIKTYYFDSFERALKKAKKLAA
jgi:hypothetical protein